MEEQLFCDICGVEIIDFESGLFHHTGVLNGVVNGHIHLCSKCQGEIKPPVFNFDDVANRYKD